MAIKDQSGPMRFAYADPPYVGVAHRYPEKTEVDHSDLILRLEADFPDGWALSLKSNSLRDLLQVPERPVRVGAWVKRYAAALANVRPVYAWEPVIFQGGRRIRNDLTLDWHLADPSQGRFHPGYVLGQKPESFCFWIFQILGMRLGDELVDVFPGSGAVAHAWEKYQGQMNLPCSRRLA